MINGRANTGCAIGLDIGGTFTDFVLVDPRGGVHVHKVLTTQDDPADAALAGIRELLDTVGIGIQQVDLLVHSTTLITNALIQQRGAPTGLLTTRGFRDVLEMRDEHRYDIYDLFLTWPPPLVPRDRRLTVEERLTRDGKVLVEPREAEVVAAVADLLARGTKALAISFLHAYKNPAHEQKVADIVRRHYPKLPVTLSSDVAPVMREYERTSTTVADAFVRPLAEAYLAKMQTGLQEQGFAGRFYLMLSGGGSASVASARLYPIRLVESGPAAGAMAASLYGQLTQSDPVLSFDMGGTTAKVCVLEGGEPAIVNVLEVARTQRFKRGSGMPLVIPSVELLEIGAGGGSIARIDEMGFLKVGPSSAGADPGPASYGRGGLEPTVTDANLLLGYLDAGYFLGGRMQLDIAAARAALQRLAERAGMRPIEAAWGVHQVVNENMAQAAHMHLLEKNWDPRRMALVAFGGAGPAHAASIARLLGVQRVIYPLGAGATSALGCLAAPLCFQFTRSLPGIVDELDWDQVTGLFAEMEHRARSALADAGVSSAAIELVRECDLRIYGQIHEVLVPVPTGQLGGDSIGQLGQAFEATYRRLYKRFSTDSILEAVNWKLTARGPARAFDLRQAYKAHSTVVVARKGQRPAYMAEAVDFVDTPIYDRYLLSPGDELVGPAIVEEREATVVLPGGSRGRMDDHGNLLVDLAAVAAPRPATYHSGGVNS